jgi:hypothetical protein
VLQLSDNVLRERTPQERLPGGSVGIIANKKMGQRKLQQQRHELKYVIPERHALAIRDFVRCFLDLDPNGADEPDLAYPVHSLYMDSPDMALYRSTINGDKNRFKLRVRFYNESEDTPVFLEIKRRMNNIISKKRVGIPRSSMPTVLTGQIPDVSYLYNQSPNLNGSSLADAGIASKEQALIEYVDMVNRLEAQPVSHVAYRREAWVQPDSNKVRVTMDRQVRCETDPDGRLMTAMQNPTYVFGDWVILELKFTDRFPNWFRELVEVFNLTQCGAAKYVDGVTLMGEDQTSELVTAHLEAHQTTQSASDNGKRDHLKRREQAIAATF